MNCPNGKCTSHNIKKCCLECKTCSWSCDVKICEIYIANREAAEDAMFEEERFSERVNTVPMFKGSKT